MNIEQEILNRCLALKKSEEKIQWTKNIYNGPYDVYALKSEELRLLIKEYKGQKFDTLNKRDLYELNYIYVSLNLINAKNLAEQKDFLKNNVDIINSWAITDTTYQHLKIINFEECLSFFDEFSSTDEEMLIRYAYLNFFNFKTEKKYLDTMLSLFKDSKYYYVMMVEAWLLSFLYIYFPQETYEYLSTSKISNEIKLKAISKICDSYRVSKEEKEKVKLLRKKIRNDL